MTQLQQIDLYGDLRRQFKQYLTGKNKKSLNLDVKNPREAIKAMIAVLPGFKKYMNEAHMRGITFAVFRGEENISLEQIDIGSNGRVIKIVPVVSGSKNTGMFMTIVGVALIAVAAFFTGGAAIGLAGGAFGAGAWGAVALVGTSMAIGGVVQMLSPQTKGLSLSTSDSDNTASYAFGGPTNTTAQGNVLGLLHGEREIGGAIISAGQYSEDQV